MVGPGLLILALLLAPGSASAQTLDAQGSASVPAGMELLGPPLLSVDGPYVVIQLVENRLYLMEGKRPVWSAPVVTGTGFRLEGGKGKSWDFGTPRGIFRVQRKEKDPVWIRPDWSYLEQKQRVPPPDHPSRRVKGTLGTTAIYIGHDLAIHGTNDPELVLRPDPDDRRASHGCIRLTNEDARTLFHAIDVGTPVLIY